MSGTNFSGTNFSEGKDGEPNDIKKIVETYQYRTEEERYARCVSMAEIEKNDFNLNISRYVSTAKPEPKVDLKEVNDELFLIEEQISNSLETHNSFLKELGLTLLPGSQKRIK